MFPNGVTASFPRFGPMPEVAKRGKVNGWSRQATQRLKRWLLSVDGDQLDGVGFAFTLTVRQLPASAKEWEKARTAWLHRLRRLDLVRLQWLTEWQRRGVPHLHGVMFFPEGSEVAASALVKHWLAVAEPYGARAESQSVKPLHALVGWLEYQSKHSVRGLKHWQRANAPKSWTEGTGRLWGVLGPWPVSEQVIEIGNGAFHRFRRGIKRWLIGQARRELEKARTEKARRAALARLRYLPGMLTDSNPSRSRVRAVGEWCPADVQVRLLAAAELRYLPAAEYVDTSTGEVLSGFQAWERARQGGAVPIESG